MQRIFKYGDIQNIILTPDKELNILMYGTPSYVIQKLYTFKNGPVFWPTMYKTLIPQSIARFVIFVFM